MKKSELFDKFKAELDTRKQAFNAHAPKKVRDRINNTGAMGSNIAQLMVSK